MRRGRYLAVEGTEGVGKTTLGRIFAKRLAECGVEVVGVREPGGTPLGEEIRAMLLHGGDMAGWTEALLFAAQRAELATAVVGPALSGGKWVVSDRSLYSSLAYQGFARGLGVERVLSVNVPGLDGTVPDLVVWLDADLRVALLRQERPDRIGAEGVCLHEKVWEGYRRLWAAGSERVVRMDGARSPEHNAGLLLSIVEERGWLDLR